MSKPCNSGDYGIFGKVAEEAPLVRRQKSTECFVEIAENRKLQTDGAIAYYPVNTDEDCHGGHVEFVKTHELIPGTVTDPSKPGFVTEKHYLCAVPIVYVRTANKYRKAYVLASVRRGTYLPTVKCLVSLLNQHLADQCVPEERDRVAVFWLQQKKNRIFPCEEDVSATKQEFRAGRRFHFLPKQPCDKALIAHFLPMGLRLPNWFEEDEFQDEAEELKRDMLMHELAMLGAFESDSE